MGERFRRDHGLRYRCMRSCGYCPKNEDIRVILKGGDLVIRYTDETVYMTGNCAKVFEGRMEI